jgi:hypothetical protein
LAKLDAELSYHACQFKLENVSRTGSVQWKNLTVFLAISHISAGVHERLSLLLKLRHYEPPQKYLNRLK